MLQTNYIYLVALYSSSLLHCDSSVYDNVVCADNDISLFDLILADPQESHLRTYTQSVWLHLQLLSPCIVGTYINVVCLTEVATTTKHLSYPRNSQSS